MAVGVVILEYAARPKGPGWRGMVFRPSRRSVLLVLLMAGAVAWLAARHRPWRAVAEVPCDLLYGRAYFTPDNRLLTGTAAGGLHTYDPETGRRVGTVLERVDPAWRLVPLNDASQVAVIDPTSPRIRVYDVRTGGVVREAANPTVLGLELRAMAPDGRRLTTSGFRGTLEGELVWDVSGDAPVERLSPVFRFGPSAGARFSCGGARMVVRERRAYVVYDAATCRELHRFDAYPDHLGGSAHYDRLYAINTSWTNPPTGWGTNHLFDTFDGRVIDVHEYGKTTKAIAAWNEDGSVKMLSEFLGPTGPVPGDSLIHRRRFVEVATGRTLNVDERSRGYPSLFTGLAGYYHHDHQRQVLRVFDYAHRQPVVVLPLGTGGTGGGLSSEGITFSPDRQTMVSHLVPAGRWAAPTHFRLYRKTGYDCPESHLGALAFPQTWLVVMLLGWAAWSLLGDARRAGAHAAWAMPRWGLFATFAAGLVLTSHFVVEACLGAWPRSPGLAVLVVAIGLGTGAVGWRVIGAAVLVGALGWCGYVGHGLWRAGLGDVAAFEFMDRAYDVPRGVGFTALAVAAVGCAVGVALVARRRVVV